MVAAALGGCGLGVRLPASTRSAGGAPTYTRPGSSAPTVTTNEIPTPPGPQQHAPVSRSAQLALRRFASRYINWDAADLKARLSALAADSVGQARTAMELTAAQTGADPELRQAGIANHGTVEAVAALAGPDHRYVVITLETTTATDSSAYQGLKPAWHLTVATVARRGSGWVISGWEPES
jgi:hypothetical protein